MRITISFVFILVAATSLHAQVHLERWAFTSFGSDSSMLFDAGGQPISSSSIYGDKSAVTEGFIQPVTDDNISVVKLDIQKISLFPNPCRDFIQIDAGPLEIERISIVDGQGKSMYLSTSWMDQKIPTSDFPAGLYFIEINTGNGQVTHIKFMKI